MDPNSRIVFESSRHVLGMTYTGKADFLDQPNSNIIKNQNKPYTFWSIPYPEPNPKSATIEAKFKIYH